MSPTQYLALPRAIQQPAVSQRAQLFGQPTQGLHLDRDAVLGEDGRKFP
jgi:hypothetical protein